MPVMGVTQGHIGPTRLYPIVFSDIYLGYSGRRIPVAKRALFGGDSKQSGPSIPFAKQALCLWEYEEQSHLLSNRIMARTPYFT
jgi:hypothetical protein